MIHFRQKQLNLDLIPKAISYLKGMGITFSVISPKEADEVSKQSSRSLVLEEFIQNDHGWYQIKVRDAKFYSWTRKMLEEQCRMKILDTNPTERTVTAETEHYGIVMDIIEFLSYKYKLSIVKND